MIAFLTSSPCVYRAPRAIINPENCFLVNLISCLPENPRCLFVASDPDNGAFTDQITQEMSQAFALAGLEFSQSTVLDRRSQDQAAALLADSDLVVLCGGHVPTQNRFFQELDLRTLLQDYPGVVLGISAGSMNAADRVYVQPEEEGESAPDFPRFAEGLGITDLNILPHYQQVKDYELDGQRLFEDITYGDSFDNVFYALVDGSYIMVDDEGAELFGEAYVITDGQLYPVCDEGDSIPLE